MGGGKDIDWVNSQRDEEQWDDRSRQDYEQHLDEQAAQRLTTRNESEANEATKV